MSGRMAGPVLRPRELARAAAVHLDDLRVQHANLVRVLRQTDTLRYVDEAAESSGRMAIPAPLAAPALSYRTHKRWAADGVVYSVHPQMLDALAQVDRDRVPAGVLAHLPHRNPLLLFPSPVPCVGAAGTPTGLIAVYVSGVDAGGRRMTDTDDADCVGYRLTMVCRDSTGLEEAATRLHIADGWFHPEVRAAAARSADLDKAARGERAHTVAQHAAALRSKLLPALDALMYVCSLGAEIEPATAPRAAAARRPARRAKPAAAETVHHVGWRLGPALADPARAQPATSTGTGGAKTPHPRRSHYGIRWTGPGKTVPRSTLIRGSFINRAQLDGPPVPTIYPAGPSNT
ncbi:hypothetical protein [Actinokineospora sp. NBRC 105648]|uniref:hypothetical protein n=1 Tax=Actinokineospora sp. NBRC 105648 TaxID=3032206 RepID=UPI0024A0F055|nr:hypothetical protein [Actinokineospora sp. NBRC 105648]GLZ43528.1 hypothetical protein Acsp05_71520 [Actinokineospora sp. NBRC 105648]